MALLPYLSLLAVSDSVRCWSVIGPPFRLDPKNTRSSKNGSQVQIYLDPPGDVWTLIVYHMDQLSNAKQQWAFRTYHSLVAICHIFSQMLVSLHAYHAPSKILNRFSLQFYPSLSGHLSQKKIVLNQSLNSNFNFCVFT